MRKSLFYFILTGTLTVFLLSACAEDEPDIQESVDTGQSANEPAKSSRKKASRDRRSKAAPKVTKAAPENIYASDSIMNKPVNFSTPEDIQKTMKLILEGEGEKAVNRLNAAMGHILNYDLSIGRDRDKLYKVLNGKTPNEIINRMKR